MVRRSILAGSWYPDKKTEIESLIAKWTDGIDVEGGISCYAGIVPHAGWYYSGSTTAKVLAHTVMNKELIVIIGGHLPPGSSILAAFEDKLETPSGTAVNRIDLIEKLGKKLNIDEDVFSDNTVEIVLAMVSIMNPDADIIWLRAPADLQAVKLADELFEISKSTALKTAVIGSTDLTHYGSNYSFTPAGRVPGAVEWVKDVNDAGILKHLLSLDYISALKHAEEEKSACSAGAAAAAVRFAQLNGVTTGRLIDYHTSYDIQHSESFVGYAGIVY